MMRRKAAIASGVAWCAGLFTAHPDAVGETYLGHLRFAARFGASMVVGGLACMIHGLLPFCLTTSGSRRVHALHAVLSRHPGRGAALARQGFEPAGDVAFDWTI